MRDVLSERGGTIAFQFVYGLWRGVRRGIGDLMLDKDPTSKSSSNKHDPPQTKRAA